MKRKKPFSARYHVDEVPLLLKPIFYLYGYAVSFLVFVYLVVVHLTSRITFIGLENLSEGSNYIYCFWHSFIFIYFTVFQRYRRHAWMQHPTWYMKTSHVMLRYVGVKKIILGSSGHSGREAAAKLVDCLKGGYSTVLLPDGPSGPAFVMKKGALHISLQSKVPIVPLRFEVSPRMEIKNWDRRRLMLPFSKIAVEFGEPIHVTSDKFQDAYDSISKFLG